jgi:hypothetical protein
MAANSLRGKFVSRSVFQRAVEQNKSLLNDIRILTGSNLLEARLLSRHYRNKFKREDDRNAQLKELLNLAIMEGKLKPRIIPSVPKEDREKLNLGYEKQTNN